MSALNQSYIPPDPSRVDNGFPTSRSSKNSWDNPSQLFVDKLRRKIRLFARTGRHEAAEFWMDKVANLSNYGNITDFLELCEYLFMDAQYAACRSLIQNKDLHKVKPQFRYILGRCYFVTGELEEALKILENDPAPSSEARTFQKDASVSVDQDRERNDDDICMESCSDNVEEVEMEESFLAAVHVLRGKIYDKLDNRQMACTAYLQALEVDPFSYDALDYLSSRQALSKAEHDRILEEIAPRARASSAPNEVGLVDVVYRNKLQYGSKHSDKNDRRNLALSKFANNPDFLLSRADYFLRRRDFVSSLDITSKIMTIKPFHRSAIPIHVAALVHLGKTALLFDLSHRLVTLYPQDVLAWYTTAAYYYVCGHMENTRRYLAKAINFDKSCGFVWLLYGHSFSREREHDQAMAAYFHAVDVMKGSFFPYLYIAREYVRTNNHVLAERFYGEAKTLAPKNPVVLHEIGILHIKKSDATKGATLGPDKKELQQAVDLFQQALVVIKTDSEEQKMMDSAVEGIYESLATAYLKLREGTETLKYANLAYQINTKNMAVLKLIGMAHILLGHCSSAMDAFQRALALNKDDQLAKRMLTETVSLCAEEGIGTITPPVDLNVQRKTRVAKAPVELPRLNTKRLLAHKKTTPLAAAKTSDVSESSAMDISVDSPLAPTFLSDFRPASVVKDAFAPESGEES